MISYLRGNGENVFGKAGAEPPRRSMTNIKPDASNLNLHELQNQRESLGLTEIRRQKCTAYFKQTSPLD